MPQVVYCENCEMLPLLKMEKTGVWGRGSLFAWLGYCCSLQRRRILVQDEATASVDTATNNIIQKTIREETSGCTVITVAHRIPTVIDNDLDEGEVIEFDSLAQLLRDNSSAFSKLVMEFLTRSSKSACH